MIKKSIFLLFCLMACVNLQAQQDVKFAYGDSDNATTVWGTGKREVVDVAMHCIAPRLVGYDLSSVEVKLQKSPSIKHVKLWLSKQLNLEQSGTVKLNAPDVAQIDATLTDAADGSVIASATLPTAYRLTDEGIYVGCTYEVDSIDDQSKAPIICAGEKAAKSFYVHSTRRYLKWADISSSSNAPCLAAHFTGVPAYRAALQAPSMVYVKTGEESSIPVTVVNYGSASLAKVSVNGNINGKNIASVIELAEPLPATYGTQTTVNVNLPALEADGAYPISLTLSRVNDQSNQISAATVDFVVDSRQLIPTYRPLVEEYTGTWCGFCPRGYVALKAMKRIYGDDFIAVACHVGDPMHVKDMTSPVPITGYPAATIDRGSVIDPYYGTVDGASYMHFETDWLAARDKYAPVDIDVSAHLSTDGTKVEAESRVISPRDVEDAHYVVEYMLVADSLKGTTSSWCQANNFTLNSADEFPEPEFSLFLRRPSSVNGLKFDDVLLASTRVDRTDVSLPTTLSAYADHVTTHEFDIFSIVSKEENTPIVQSRKNLRVVAVVKDAYTQSVVNTAECQVDASTYFTEGIQHVSVDANASIAPSAAYDLSGRRVISPTKGFYIVGGKKIIK